MKHGEIAVEMNKLQEVVEKTRTFITEVRTELKKCSWPTRSELLQSTVVVIVSIVIIAMFVGFSDVLLMGMLRLIAR